jgi:dipeptidase E
VKLFLTSYWLTPKLRPAFFELVGRADNIKVALIENAADPGSGQWVPDNYDALVEARLSITKVDLRQETKHLEDADVIWVGGGNTFYLRWILKHSGADAIIRRHVADGKVYAGCSAGSIVAGPTLKYFDAGDDPAAAPELILDGYSFTDQIVIPHWYGQPYKVAQIEKFRAEGLKTCPLTNDQALIINGDRQTVI